MRASGRPTNSTACCVAIASGSASGSARPTSSLAKITMRRAMKRKSSPACSIFASQYIAFFSSDARTINQFFQFLDPERFELKNLRARDKRTVDVKKWVVSGRADQLQISAFNIRKENVLLRFVEMVDLVDEQNCFLTRGAGAVGRACNHTPHFRDVAFNATQPDEFRVGHVGDDVSERRFAGAGRP